RAQGTIGRVIASEVADVEREPDRSSDPAKRGEGRPRLHPALRAWRTVRREAVNGGDRKTHAECGAKPEARLESQPRKAPQLWKHVPKQRECGNGNTRENKERDQAHSDRNGDESMPDERP